MEISVKELAAMIGGKIEGNEDARIRTFSPIEEAEEGSLSFLSNPKYTDFLYTTKATAVLVDNNFKADKDFSATLIRVEDVYTTLSGLLDKFNAAQKDTKTGIEQPCHISLTAKIGSDVYVGAFAYLGENVEIGNGSKIYPQSYIGDGVKIGENTTVYPGVKIYANCEIGNNSILHAGCVIGSDGFGFAPQADGSYKKVPQTGKVIVGNDVEIGANTTIDRATIKATIIEDGVKLDNLIQVAHNVEIGQNTAIASQTGISGSTKLGKNCIIGGQVGIVGHINIADGSQIGAQSGIAKAISVPKKRWFGSPAIDYKDALKSQIIFKKLPELYNRIQQLEQAIEKK
ncbi:MAG: UDP-3-O-(3-hydroxymyristoyl)glucosamine N-acyltransferase [Sphingobacteriales bacterium]|nr:MAG: UDP-3-O-(3-hydroxymyristoyl)glucosamine N-acyltransferase [Sphingobacteriales bacterium]